MAPRSHPFAFKIARMTLYTGNRDWTRYPEQRSDPVWLEAGKSYYLEAIHKQGSGWNNLSVAWQVPGKDPELMLREDLRRFKALMEAGEVPNIEGQTHGPRSALGKAIEAAYPEKRKPAEFETDLQQVETQRSAS